MAERNQLLFILIADGKKKKGANLITFLSFAFCVRMLSMTRQDNLTSHSTMDFSFCRDLQHVPNERLVHSERGQDAMELS